MTEEELKELFAAVAEVVQPRLAGSEPLRRAVRLLGQWLIEESRRAELRGEPDRPEDVSSGPPVPVEGEATEVSGDEQAQQTTVVPLSLGDQTVRVPVPGTTEEIKRAHAALESEPVGAARADSLDAREATEIDLGLIAKRCRLKADSCRLFIERRTATGDPAAEAPLIERMDSMIAQAKAMPNCFLWVLWRERTQPDDAAVVTIARCYDALAETAALVELIDELADRSRPEHLREAMELLAEAHSALRVALEATWLSTPDIDQNEAHYWMRHESEQRRIFVRRFMKLDDPADPTDAAGIIQQAAELSAEIQEHASRLRRIDEGFKRIRYHAGFIEGQEEDSHHFEKIAEAISELSELGVPTTDRRYRREIDAPMAESLLENPGISEPAATVLQNVGQWHKAARSAVPSASPEPRRWSDQVLQVRRLLAGRRVVIVGGEPRAEAVKRVQEAFDLADVVWVRLTEHGTGKPMQAPITRPETALVLVLVKLAGTLHTEEATSYARDAGRTGPGVRYRIYAVSKSAADFTDVVLLRAPDRYVISSILHSRQSRSFGQESVPCPRNPGPAAESRERSDSVRSSRMTPVVESSSLSPTARSM